MPDQDDTQEQKYPFLQTDDDAANGAPDAASEEAASNASSEAGGVDDLVFDDDGLGEKLRYATPEQLDGANFGVIQVDDDGVVQFFNRYESELSGVTKDQAEGSNFFTEVAPCTNNRLFRGRFKKGVRRGELDEEFTYTYTYKMRPTLVNVHLYRDEAGHNWITVQKC
jgi:photoactive yellow protein